MICILLIFVVLYGIALKGDLKMADLKSLLKWRENFIALSLAMVIPFTCAGCQSKKTEEEINDSVLYNQEEEPSSVITEVDEELVLEEPELGISSYLEAIMSIPIMYNYEEYYLTYEQVEKLTLEAEKELECHNEYSGNLEKKLKN